VRVIELKPAADAAVWDAAEAIHMRRAVLGAVISSEPSPYVYVENIFSTAAYAAIERSFPTDPNAFRRWSNPGEPSLRFGNYEQRQEIDVPREALALPPAQRDFWTAMAALVCGPNFARTLLDRFEPYARARFGAQIDDPSFVDARLPGSMILNQHDAGYFLGPHTDRSEKVFTCLFYFPEHEGLDHLGTTLYTPLQRDFTCSGLGHYDPARFERGETIPYRPNSALIFARTDIMFHGVHALTAQELQGSRRRGIQMQFWLRNTRPREQCKTTFAAALPATMRAGGEQSVAYELTNRDDRVGVEPPIYHPTRLPVAGRRRRGRRNEFQRADPASGRTRFRRDAEREHARRRTERTGPVSAAALGRAGGRWVVRRLRSQQRCDAIRHGLDDRCDDDRIAVRHLR
jgi:hypothetical protein